jgi:hypothetical protein
MSSVIAGRGQIGYFKNELWFLISHRFAVYAGKQCHKGQVSRKRYVTPCHLSQIAINFHYPKEELWRSSLSTADFETTFPMLPVWKRN